MAVYLAIERGVFNEMLTAAHRVAPMEACGLCGGTDERVTRFYELTNMDASSEHYSMRPEEQFAAAKDMRNNGLKMLAVWHSHPATPARMSDEDLRLALAPDVVYLILSLAAPDAPDIRGYSVADGGVKPVDVTIIERSSNEVSE